MEPIPCNAPPPKGKEVDVHMLIDSNHAGDTQTRRSRTEFMMYLNMTLIIRYSKKHSTIEASASGTEFIAMKV